MSLDCTIPRPSIEELQQTAKTEISTRMLGGAPVLPMSNEDVLSFIMAGTVNLMHGYVAQGLKESDPKDMCCDNLVTYAARRGIFLQAAERARGVVVITGDPGAAIPPNIRFVDDASQEYKLDPSYVTNPVVIGPGGTAALFVAASGGGTRYNQEGGATLTVSTTLPGINVEATVSSAGIIGGANDETCEQLRTRVLDSEKSGAVSTNATWFMSQTLRWPGVSRVCTDECEACCEQGLVLYPFFDGAYEDGVPPAAVIEALNLWMFGPARTHGEGLAPIGVLGEYRSPVPTYMTVHVDCAVGCTDDAASAIFEAVNSVIKAETCVGSRVCLEHLHRAVLNALGDGNCPKGVTFEFDASILHNDGTFAYLNCGHYLKQNPVDI